MDDESRILLGLAYVAWFLFLVLAMSFLFFLA